MDTTRAREILGIIDREHQERCELYAILSGATRDEARRELATALIADLQPETIIGLVEMYEARTRTPDPVEPPPEPAPTEKPAESTPAKQRRIRKAAKEIEMPTQPAPVPQEPLMRSLFTPAAAEKQEAAEGAPAIDQDVPF